MSLKSDSTYDSQCRVCLCENLTMFPLFNENKYSLKLSECSNITVAIDDGFPNSICQKCLDDLPIAYDFVMRCRESDQKLKQYKGLSQKNVLNIENDIVINEMKIKDEPDFIPVGIEINKYNSSLDDSKDFKSLTIKKERCKDKEKNTNNSHSKPSLQCPVCDYKATVPSLMVIHSRIHTGEKPFKCDFCERAFNLKGTLKQHVVRCHLSKEKNVICEVCGKGFYSARDANTHMRVHTKETPYHCHLCPKSYSQQSSLIIHVRKHTGEKPFSCKICGKKFISTSMLNKHNLVHSKERPFVCKICGVAVKSKDTLSQHQLTHQGNKSFVCDQCGMAFLKKDGLRLHTIAVHSEKSGQCTVCNKQFSNLESHMRTHTGETPFQCHVCGKSFSWQQSLTTHMTKHGNCKCSVCGKRFTASKFAIHMATHTGEKPYKCKICEQTYARIQSLNKHIRRQHKIITDANQIHMQDINKANQTRLEETLLPINTPTKESSPQSDNSSRITSK